MLVHGARGVPRRSGRPDRGRWEGPPGKRGHGLAAIGGNEDDALHRQSLSGDGFGGDTYVNFVLYCRARQVVDGTESTLQPLLLTTPQHWDRVSVGRESLLVVRASILSCERGQSGAGLLLHEGSAQAPLMLTVKCLATRRNREGGYAQPRISAPPKIRAPRRTAGRRTDPG